MAATSNSKPILNASNTILCSSFRRLVDIYRAGKKKQNSKWIQVLVGSLHGISKWPPSLFIFIWVYDVSCECLSSKFAFGWCWIHWHRNRFLIRFTTVVLFFSFSIRWLSFFFHNEKDSINFSIIIIIIIVVSGTLVRNEIKY